MSKINAMHRNDMPQSLEDFRVSYESIVICPFDDEVITDLAHSYRDAEGVQYHSQECASNMSEVLFYETLGKMEEVKTVVVTGYELEMLVKALKAYREELAREAVGNTEPPAQESGEARAMIQRLEELGK